MGFLFFWDALYINNIYNDSNKGDDDDDVLILITKLRKILNCIDIHFHVPWRDLQQENNFTALFFLS